MRWVLIFIFLSTYPLHGEVVRFWIGDTAHVRFNVYDGDTNYHWKQYHGFVECYMYYDKEQHEKAAYRNYGRFNIHSDSAWFRNGKIREWSVRTADCSTCWTSRRWYASGQLKVEWNQVRDTSVWIRYYESGKISGINKHWLDTGDFPNDPGWHYQIEYYENGQRKFDPVNPRQRGSQPEIEYYESGKKKSETTMFGYINNLGPFTEWHENGQIKCAGQYADLGRKTNGISLTDKTGTWSYYSESGKLIKEELYEDGKLVKTIEY